MLDRLRPRREPDGTLYFDGVTRDITERRRLEDDLRRSVADMEQAHRELDAAHRAVELRARTDDLTGTYNRRHFTELVTAAEARVDATDCALLLLDADHFKQVNDTHGHAIGDAVLVELARRLRVELAAGELLARWGGEEFAVLLRDVTTDAELRRAPSACARSSGRSPMLADRTTIRLTVSIGGARHRPPGQSRSTPGSSRQTTRSTPRRAAAATACASPPTSAHGRRASASIRGRDARARASPSRPRCEPTRARPTPRRSPSLAGRIAERLGLPAGMVMRCRLGGWLHDVGKAAIPDAILSSPGP